jgi:hypothetical protein
VIGLLLAVYPAGWRQRYGEEFRAVLESRPLGPFDVADVLLGALDARLMPRRIAASTDMNGGQTVLLRVGGLGAVVGGSMFFVGLAVASANAGGGPFWISVAAIGTLGILAALVGLSAFQAYRDPKLAWAAFVIPGIGTLVSFVGMLGMAVTSDGDAPFIGSWAPWAIWMVGFLTTLVGSILFAIATVQAAVFSRRAAQALAWSAAAVILIAMGGVNGGGTTGETILVAGSLGAFSLSWVVLGASALKRGPITIAQRSRDGAAA